MSYSYYRGIPSNQYLPTCFSSCKFCCSEVKLYQVTPKNVSQLTFLYYFLGCKWFTFLSEFLSCMMYSDCDTLDESCVTCISGEKRCEVEEKGIVQNFLSIFICISLL